MNTMPGNNLDVFWVITHTQKMTMRIDGQIKKKLRTESEGPHISSPGLYLGSAQPRTLGF